MQIEESRDMHRAARAVGKDVTLVHGVEGLDNRIRSYCAQLEFLSV